MKKQDDIFLCLDRDIKEGAFKTFSMFGEELIAKREKGKITVAINKCAHRGVKAIEGSGILKECDMKCPYHGRVFQFEEPLPTWKMGEFIFIGWDEIREPETYSISENLGEEFGWFDTEVECPFYLWVQNTADPLHLPSVHSSFVSLFASNKPYAVNISEGFSSYKLKVKELVRLRYAKLLRKNEKEISEFFYHAIFVPHLSVTCFMGVFYSVETAVQIKNKTHVKTRFFTAKNLDAPVELLREALEANYKILQEDKKIIELLAKYFDHYKRPNYAESEKRVAAYMGEIYARNYAPFMKKDIFR